MGHLAEALEVSVFVAYRRDPHVTPEPGAVRANVPAFCLHAPLLMRPLQQPRREVELDVLGRVKARHVLADDLRRTVSLDSFCPRIPGSHASRRVEHEDRVVSDTLHEQAEAPIHVGERLARGPRYRFIGRVDGTRPPGIRGAPGSPGRGRVPSQSAYGANLRGLG